MWRVCKEYKIISISFMWAVLLLSAVLSAPALAAPTAVPITGEIESLTLTDPANIYSGGRMVVGGTTVVLPKNLLIDLPANRLTLQQIFAQAPAGCKAAGQSGLAKNDTCNPSGTGGFATISAVHSNAGDVIAGDVLIEKGKEAVTGQVTYINYADGYFRVNGLPNDPTTGTMLRLNDPTGRHTVQQGLGCAGGPNCSPDPRFTLDPDNYVIAFSTGYPVCIPSTIPRPFPGLPAITGIAAIPAGTAQAAGDGTGDLLCPSTNRTPALLVEPPVNDSRRFAPIMIGDSVTAEGNFETIGGVRFVSVHTMRVNKALATKNDPDQPDYLFLEEVFMEAPGFQNQRARALIIGFTTLAPTDVDFWSIHRDPATNAIHEFPLASIQGCDLADKPGQCSSQGLAGAGANIFRIRYDVDFLLGNPANPGFTPGGAIARLNPCLQLQASPRFRVSNPNICFSGNTLANTFGIMSPIPHEVQARTGHYLDNKNRVWITLDVRGNAATSGQYLFPFGMNLGGIETADFLEIDVNLLATPKSFEGIPWNLDRRLSPSGCLNGVCEATPQPLDPFPYTGLDPRLQAEFLVAGLPGGTPKGSYSDPNYTRSTLSVAADRVLSYVSGIPDINGRYNFDGNSTVLPLTLAVDPPAQGVIAPITTLPLACVAGGIAPVAQNDTAVTNTGVAVTIPVLSNDTAPVGVINFASVAVSLVSSGTATANLDGTVTFTPAAGFAGTATFNYTVQELTSGAVSNSATVTITVIGPPVAFNDSAVTNKNVPVVILALSNDVAPSGTLDPASILVSQLTTSNGVATSNVNGTITYTPAVGFSGNDTFTYSVANTAGTRSNAATVSVIINNVSTLPLAVNDAVATSPSTTVTINILANDQAFGTTLDPATVILSALTPTTSGTLFTSGTGTVDFVPAPGFAGPASFTYTVNDLLSQTSNTAIVSIVVSSPPTATPDAATTLEDTAVTFDLAGNDVAQIGSIAPASVIITSAPAKGVVTNLGNGSVTYTPNLNTNGIDTFTYTIGDTAGGLSLPGLVTVTVTPVNDPPTAGNLNLTIAEDTALPITLVGTDPDIGDILTYTITSGPLLNGTLTGTPPNMTFTPNLNYNGPASFTYTVTDNGVPPFTSAPATVNITITPVNDPPITVNDAASTSANLSVVISVLANDTDVDGTIAINTVAVTQPANGVVVTNPATGTVTYTPNLNFTGTDTFTYTVADNLGAVSAPATVTVSVAGATGTVAVGLAQFRTVVPGVSGDWRIEGTGTPGAVVTIYVGSTIPGPVVGTIAIDAAGVWKFQAVGSIVLPGPTNTISVQTNTGAARTAFPVAVR